MDRTGQQEADNGVSAYEVPEGACPAVWYALVESKVVQDSRRYLEQEWRCPQATLAYWIALAALAATWGNTLPAGYKDEELKVWQEAKAVQYRLQRR